MSLIVDLGAGSDREMCRYAVTREASSLISHFGNEGDVHEQGSTRDSAQVTNTAAERQASESLSDRPQTETSQPEFSDIFAIEDACGFTLRT